jgi:uncharacterized membrane protein YkvA (DUF1232 family)
MYVVGFWRCNMNNESRWQGGLESFGETESVPQRSEDPFPLVPAASSSRSLALSVISALVALVYVCSPIDLIPEAFVPWVGFVDDVLIFIGGMALARAMLVAALSERARYKEALCDYEPAACLGR